MQAAGAETGQQSGGKSNHCCITGLFQPSLQKVLLQDKFGVAADVALQQAVNRRPASIDKRASSRSKSAPRNRQLPSAVKKSEAVAGKYAKGAKIGPQPGQGTQVIYLRQLTLQLVLALAQILFAGSTHHA